MTFSLRQTRVFIRALGSAVLLFAAVLRAHEHIDTGPDPADANRLALTGSASQTMLYVPRGEPFSLYLPQFPGGYYGGELTFSSEDPAGSRPRIELLSVSGPPGGNFSFWEAGAVSPTWSRTSGWSAAGKNRPSFITYEDGTGYGHIHGRAFTATHPGIYTVGFRAVDDAGLREPSAIKTVTVNVLATPPLTIRVEAGETRLSFQSRAFLTYDLQVSTDLQTWTGIPGAVFLDGTGARIDLADPLAGRLRVFYRLVEYY